jgi:hypothetical protein
MLKSESGVQDWAEIPSRELDLQEMLGSGASGEVRAASWNGVEVAAKIFTTTKLADIRTELQVRIAAIQHSAFVPHPRARVHLQTERACTCHDRS